SLDGVSVGAAGLTNAVCRNYMLSVLPRPTEPLVALATQATTPGRDLFLSHLRRGVKNRLDGHKFAKLPDKTTVFVRTACRSSPHCFSCLRALPICLPRSL